MRKTLTERLSNLKPAKGRLSVGGWIAVVLLGLIVLSVLAAPLLTSFDPNEQLAVADKSPSPEHLLGLDSQGRDILSRLLYGGRWSLMIGLGATALALIAGAVIGAFAATSRKAVDEVVMRVLDIIMAFPGIALAAVLVAVFGRNVGVLILAIGFLYMPSIARIVRANVMAQFGEDYVSAEKIIGARRAFIVVRHVAVNVAAPVLVFATVMIADAIVFEASLSFIGAGVQPPNPSWGSVIADGKNLMLSGGWWATFFPGALIFLTVLCFNILSEGLTDAIAAPSAKSAKAAASSVEAEAAAEVAEAKPVTALPGLDRAGARISARLKPTPDVAPILTVEDLRISFPGRHNGVDVVDGVSFDVRPGEVLGLIGESGCGKSQTSLAIMGLEPRGAEVKGSMVFDGRELIGMRAGSRRALMGGGMSMIYQDALSALNPAMTIKAQLTQLTKRGGKRTPHELLELVNLDPERTLRAYPHELSGGQRQRVVIAMALSRDPQLIIADEPTTALDVTVQAQVMELLLGLQEKLGFALILVSHDLALVSDIVDRVVVMYGGQIAERGRIDEVVGAPQHHYTRGLLSAVLSLESGEATLTQIPGVVPSPADFPSGCRFADRCPAATAQCTQAEPVLLGMPLHHEVACFNPAGVRHESQEVSA